MLSSTIETSTTQSTAYANRHGTPTGRRETTLAHGITWKLSCTRWPPAAHGPLLPAAPTVAGATPIRRIAYTETSHRASARRAGNGARARSAVTNCDRALRSTPKASPPSKHDSTGYSVSRASARALRPVPGANADSPASSRIAAGGAIRVVRAFPRPRRRPRD